MSVSFNNLWSGLVDVATFPGAVAASLVAATIFAVVTYFLSKAFVRRLKVRKNDRVFYDTMPHTPTGKHFVGRDDVLTLLDEAWTQGDTHVLALVAEGGVGKTAIINQWVIGRERRKPPIEPDFIFAWSFQNQGSKLWETSSARFFQEAFAFFGDESPKKQSEREKGNTLAALIRAKRGLLVLDGLEVFQPWAQDSVLRDQLKDEAIFSLLDSLALSNAGLCVLLTRRHLDERLLRRETVREQELGNLPLLAGVQLLRKQGIKGKDAELKAVVKEYKRHAYSLVLLAAYLTRFAKGDIRRRDTLPDLMDDVSEDNWQGQRVMLEYAKVLKGTPDLSLLYLVSLFDGAVERELILEIGRGLLRGGLQGAHNKLHFAALREPTTWLAIFKRLRQMGLLLGSNSDVLDLHPLVRAFFRSEFALKDSSMKTLVHKMLYEYYKALPDKEQPDTLEDMQPLFHAVAHGCAAGLHQQALHEVYWPRVLRSGENYLCSKLGAFSDDLAVVAHFFSQPWRTPAAGLGEIWQAGVLNWAGFRLRALGRLREAVEPLEAALEMYEKKEDPKESAIAASNLSELQLTLGQVAVALDSGERSVGYADQSGELFERMARRTTHADALHQSGQVEAALTGFVAAEQFQREHQPEYPRLYSLRGFRYCDLLLAEGKAGEVLERAKYALNLSEQFLGKGLALHDIGLDKVSLGRAYHAQGDLPQARDWLDQAVAGLRKAGGQDDLPRGLLARAALWRDLKEWGKAQRDLAEVWDIAEPSGMRLHLTDYHLERARLLLAQGETPPSLPLSGEEQEAEAESDATCGQAPSLIREGGGRVSLQEHIVEAERLITETGYHRRDQELRDLQKQAGVSA